MHDHVLAGACHDLAHSPSTEGSQGRELRFLGDWMACVRASLLIVLVCVMGLSRFRAQFLDRGITGEGAQIPAGPDGMREGVLAGRAGLCQEAVEPVRGREAQKAAAYARHAHAAGPHPLLIRRVPVGSCCCE